MTTNDISPYLQRPVRTLEEVMAEVEQQRLETSGPGVAAAIPPKSGDASLPDGVAANKERI